MSTPRRRGKKRGPPQKQPAWRRVPTAWKVVVGIAAGFAAIAAAITTVPSAISSLEPIAIATHGHVKEVLAPVDLKADTLTYWRLQDQTAKAKADEGGWAIQLAKEKDPQAQVLIRKEIERAQTEQRKNQERAASMKVPEWVK